VEPLRGAALTDSSFACGKLRMTIGDLRLDVIWYIRWPNIKIFPSTTSTSLSINKLRTDLTARAGLGLLNDSTCANKLHTLVHCERQPLSILLGQVPVGFSYRLSSAVSIK